MGFWAAPLEAVRGGAACVIQRGLADTAQLLGLTVVDALRRYVTDA